MRILFFSTAFPQPFEPSRNPDNLERCRALGRRHALHVVSPFSWLHVGATATAMADSGLSVSRPLFAYPPGIVRGSHAWCMWQCIRVSVARTVAAFRPDAILSYWTYPDTAVALRVAQLAAAPCVGIVGGSDVLSIDPTSPGAAGRRVRRVLQRVDAIAAVSDSIKDHITTLGIDANKIRVLPAAVDQTVFFPGPRQEARRRLGVPLDADVVLWVGRMVAVKALDVLVDAMASIVAARPSVRLYLVGDGPLRRPLSSMIATRGLQHHVVFAGRVPHRDLPDYYRAADVTVLPSRWEGMPNTLLESHACGTPFVASAVGAIPDLARAGVDEIVPPGDCRRLAEAIVRCIATGGQRHITPRETGGWDAMADCLSDMLDQARGLRRSATAAATSPARVHRMHRHLHRFRW